MEHQLVRNLQEQYRYVMDQAKALAPGRTMAVLYRNNDSAIPLVDLMDREGMGFGCAPGLLTLWITRSPPT